MKLFEDDEDTRVDSLARMTTDQMAYYVDERGEARDEADTLVSGDGTTGLRGTGELTVVCLACETSPCQCQSNSENFDRIRALMLRSSHVRTYLRSLYGNDSLREIVRKARKAA